MTKTKILKVIIKKDLNLFVFASTLANVRGSSLRHTKIIKKLLRASGGRLTVAEKQNLVSFKKVFQSVEYNFVEAHFIRFSDLALRHKLVRIVGSEKTAIVNNTLRIIQPRFDRFWKREQKKLLRAKRGIEKNCRNISRVATAITTLCNMKRDVFPPIYLIFGERAEELLTGWYSSFDKNEDIILEYSPTGELSLFALGVILHEVFHVVLHRNKGLWNRLNFIAKKHTRILQYIDRKTSPEILLEECLLSVFAPEGVLIGEYFDRKPVQGAQVTRKMKSGPVGLTTMRRYCAWTMRNKAREYLTNEKNIDAEFLKLLLEKIKEGVATP